jgi:4-hydroxy-3-polyprenylbenzoate decarboxylase
MGPKLVRNPPCQEPPLSQGDDVDLYELPIQHLLARRRRPAGHLAAGHHPRPEQDRAEPRHLPHAAHWPNKLIMRWLSHRGGALDYRDWQLAASRENATRSPSPWAPTRPPPWAPSRRCPTPCPSMPSPASCAAARPNLRVHIRRLCQATTICRYRLTAELHPGRLPRARETGDEGPFGDHTGYYNEVERFPVFTVDAITHRETPIYHSTYTGRPPDEPAILGVALNEVFVPLLQKQFPEIVDFYLPPEGCSYRMAVVTMRKEYPGHAKRVMLGVWSFLRQFMYTKFIIVTTMTWTCATGRT